MNNIQFNYKSARSEKARISVWFNQIKVILLIFSVFVMMLAGLYLLVSDLAIGWVLIGFSVIPVMTVEWYNGELHHMKPSQNPKSIDDVLSADLLGRISKQPTPLEVAKLIGLVSGGHFYETRFGISNKFLQDLSSDRPDDMQDVWQHAWDLQNQTNSRNISASILIVSLIKSSNNGEKLLSHLQLGIDDLIRGIGWYNHIRLLIEKSRMARVTGGIARDWSFGWTPLLDQFGQNISRNQRKFDVTVSQLVAHEDVLNQMLDIFARDGRQNVALVGAVGVGKTEIVHSFAARLLDGAAGVSQKIMYNQVFLLDASSLIAAAPGRGQLEKLVPSILNEAYRAKNIIICLDNAELFFEEGVGSVNIANVLMPFLESGKLKVILTIEEQKYLSISKMNPSIVNLMNRLSVDIGTYDETMSVMQDRIVELEYKNKVIYMYQAMTESYRLGQRYVYDLSMPGRALQMLESAANYAEPNGLVTAGSVQRAVEESTGVKVGIANDQEEKNRLLNLEDLIHGRMVNQKRAVKVVSDALRRARVGVRNQSRPIGTFLFLGPTGVGKTELAKSLADVYFNGEGHMIRLDMNEYSADSDALRLIQDGVGNANSLTAKVMKQPFSVVLLDEIEKASESVLATLLQLLDEGVLRDEKNREVSFRDAIIIATSNAGADRIREYIDRGMDIEQFEDQLIDELISNNQFKPEFINRFDEVVYFRPLDKKELLQVVDMILDGVNKTLESQKISVIVADNAKKYLVDKGYDPRLGARPMRRVVQRAVENTVAELMLKGEIESGSVVEISLAQVKQMLDSHERVEEISSR